MIKAVTDNKERYMDLLLIGDEQEDMVRRYLDRATFLYVRRTAKLLQSALLPVRETECAN